MVNIFFPLISRAAVVLCRTQFSRWKNRVTSGRLVHPAVWPAQDETQRSHHSAPTNKGLFRRPVAQCTFQSRALC